jgi:transmembrane sensor
MYSNKAEMEAADWLARLDRDDPSAADLAEFGRWKATDPHNVAAYVRLAATWQALDRIQAIRPRLDEPIDNDYLNAALHQPAGESAQSGVADSTGDSQSSIRPRRPWFFLAAAASVLVVLAGLWITDTVGGQKAYRTNVGGFQRILLEDQSTIELNTDSEVRVALTPGLRKVELVRGEASFEVAHDAARPFIVSAGKTAVRAVGTKFDVRRLENSVEVTVDEGKVAVGDSSLLERNVDVAAMNIPQLTAGQSALANGNGFKLKELPKREMTRKLAWQNQMLEFDGDTLADVVAQFNRYNARQLVIADSSLATLQIGGYFRPTNLDAFIAVLQSDFGIRVSSEGKQLILAPARAN